MSFKERLLEMTNVNYYALCVISSNPHFSIFWEVLHHSQIYSHFWWLSHPSDPYTHTHTHTLRASNLGMIVKVLKLSLVWSIKNVSHISGIRISMVVWVMWFYQTALLLCAMILFDGPSVFIDIWTRLRSVHEKSWFSHSHNRPPPPSAPLL